MSNSVKQSDWNAFVKKLSALNDKATQEMKMYLEKVGGFSAANTDELLAYAYALVEKYGTASGTLSALWYDAMAELSGVAIASAEVADIVSEKDFASTMMKASTFSENLDYLSAIVGREVKQVSADTLLKNAMRDKAQFAWIPSGDTCAFCTALASRGWQNATQKTVNGGHAEHIHSNCNCMFAIRFTEDTSYSGYDPDEYKQMYDSADGRNSKSKINSLRREDYAKNKDKINAQKRAAYALRKEAEENS